MIRPPRRDAETPRLLFLFVLLQEELRELWFHPIEPEIYFGKTLRILL
jgi:hypothetical protein